MFLKVTGNETFERVRSQLADDGGIMDWTVGNFSVLGEVSQLHRLLDMLSGLPLDPKDPSKRPTPRDPSILEWRHQLRKTENGKPIGDPLDLSKKPQELGIRAMTLLFLEFAPKDKVQAPINMKAPAAPAKKPPPPNPTGPAAAAAKVPPPNPTGPAAAKPATTTPAPAGGAGEGGGGDASAAAKKPGGKKKIIKKVVKKKKAEGEGGDTPSGTPAAAPASSPPATTTTPAAAATQPPPPKTAAEAPPAASAPLSPKTQSSPPPQKPANAAAAAPPAVSQPPPAMMTGEQELHHMTARYRGAQDERDDLARAGYHEHDAYLRRQEMARSDDSIRRMREETDAFVQRERVAALEEAVQRREREMERQERAVAHREELMRDERRRLLELSSAAPAAAATASPRPSSGLTPEVVLSITSLQNENREMRDMLRELKGDLQRSLAAPAAAGATTTVLPPQPQAAAAAAEAGDANPPLSAKVRGMLNVVGLGHYGEVFREQQMDEIALQHATEADLAELGLSAAEQVRLLAVVRSSAESAVHVETSLGAMAMAAAPPMASPSSPLPLAAPAPGSPGAGLSASDAAFHKSVLTAFYSKYDADKVGHVDFLIDDLRGGIEDVYPGIMAAYNLETSVFAPRVAEVLSVGRYGAAPVLAALWHDREVELLSTLTGRLCQWAELTDHDGRMYYFSDSFNLSQWARPVSLAQSDARLYEAQSFAQHAASVRSVLPPYRGGGSPYPAAAYGPVPVAPSQGRQRTPSPSPPRLLHQRDEHHKAWVVAFLLKYAPHRIIEVSELLRRHSGPELVELLSREYGVPVADV
eukprot:Rhum_TRINITY_DN13704_c4_g1::Rhum_TRINITY_DN13704_c4_g1_i1::g.63741::m.63741